MTARNAYKTRVLLAFGIALVLTLLVVYSASANALIDNTEIDDPYRTEEFTVNTPADLEVSTSGGHITVEASEANIIRVEMYVRKNGRELAPSDTDLDDFDIEISQSGNKVTASAKRPGGLFNWGSNGISISFVVYTPVDMTTDLNTSGGHISVNGLNGEQDLSTSGGHLEMHSLRGSVSARTSGGHIKIQDFSGQMEARTSGGHIEVDRAEGTINLRTSGGHISLRELAGTIEASTSGGSIEADLMSIQDHVDLRTSGGHININVPDGIGLNLDLRGNSVQTQLKNFSGSVERDEVSGTINGGGPQITARTSGGSVRVTYN